MAKGTNYWNLKKAEITVLKGVRKSQRNLKALVFSKTVICNCLKSPNKYGTRKHQKH